MTLSAPSSLAAFSRSAIVPKSASEVAAADFSFTFTALPEAESPLAAVPPLPEPQAAIDRARTAAREPAASFCREFIRIIPFLICYGCGPCRDLVPRRARRGTVRFPAVHPDRPVGPFRPSDPSRRFIGLIRRTAPTSRFIVPLRRRRRPREESRACRGARTSKNRGYGCELTRLWTRDEQYLVF